MLFVTPGVGKVFAESTETAICYSNSRQTPRVTRQAWHIREVYLVNVMRVELYHQCHLLSCTARDENVEMGDWTLVHLGKIVAMTSMQSQRSPQRMSIPICVPTAKIAQLTERCAILTIAYATDLPASRSVHFQSHRTRLPG